tara:strand:+ start:1282 stop:1626 length:345 start_codon:yes stop_codon:yes gene_type:complete
MDFVNNRTASENDEKKQLRHLVEAAEIDFDDDESFTESDVEATKRLLCKFAPNTIDYFVTSKFGMAQPERINDDIIKIHLRGGNGGNLILNIDKDGNLSPLPMDVGDDASRDSE